MPGRQYDCPAVREGLPPATEFSSGGPLQPERHKQKVVGVPSEDNVASQTSLYFESKAPVEADRGLVGREDLEGKLLDPLGPCPLDSFPEHRSAEALAACVPSYGHAELDDMRTLGLPAPVEIGASDNPVVAGRD